MMENINWDVFTRAEKDKIMKARQVGDVKHLANVVDMMTPAKEIQLQKIVDFLTPLAKGFESKVRTEMIKHFKKKGVSGPQNPNEEEKWENKLKEEYSIWLSKKQDKEAKRIESLSRKKGDTESKELKEKEESIDSTDSTDSTDSKEKPLDLKKMSRKELIEVAEDNDVPTSGTKEEIIEKLNKVLNE